jgi:hypothetical protein
MKSLYQVDHSLTQMTRPLITLLSYGAAALGIASMLALTNGPYNTPHSHDHPSQQCTSHGITISTLPVQGPSFD